MNRYSLDEKKRIVELVKESPTNLAMAFDRASAELGRSREGIETHWHKYLKHEGRIFKLPKGLTNQKNYVRIEKEVLRARLEAKLAKRGMVKSTQARADVLAIRKALRALNK